MIDAAEFHLVAEAFVSGPAPWPMWRPAEWSYVRLHAATPPDHVATVVARLAEECGIDLSNLTPGDAVSRIVAHGDAPSLSGGVEIVAPGCVVRPGCCGGVDDLAEWRAFLATGASPWCGHDPDPRLERAGDVVRAWSDEAGRPGACHVELSVERFAAGLDALDRDLAGFADRLAEWCPPDGPRLAAWFSDAFERRA